MRNRFVSPALTIVLSLGPAQVGCRAPATVGASGGKPGGVDPVMISLDGAANGEAGPVALAPSEDANCGNQTYGGRRVPADVMLVLDRSGSMNYSIAAECWCDPSAADGKAVVCGDTGNCSERWSSLTSAVNATLADAAGAVHFGLKLFSTPGSTGSYAACTVDSGVEVPIAADTAATIAATIAATRPGNNTPTAAAITRATAYLASVADPYPKVILLATDGEPNCPADGTSQNPDLQGTLAAIRAARAAGFDVYIVGIGPSVGNLDSFAEAGGTGTAYAATSAEALAQALAAISRAVATCTFNLEKAPPDAGNVAVYLDRAVLDRDPVNGWSYGGTSATIVLHGVSCDRVMSGQAHTLQVLFGCGASAPPVIP